MELRTGVAPLNPSYPFLSGLASVAAAWTPALTAEFLHEALCLVCILVPGGEMTRPRSLITR